MINFAVRSGSWSKKGNFTGKNAFGKDVFIHESKMSTLGYKVGDAVTPFFVIADDVAIGAFQLDATGLPVLGKDGKPSIKLNADGTPDKSTIRFEALSAFATKQSLLDAYADEASLEGEVEFAQANAIASIGALKSAESFAEATL